METLWMEITKIVIELIVTGVVVLIGMYLIPEIKSRIGEEKFNKIVYYVDIAVRAAEQMFKESGLGVKKKEYVLDFINGVLSKMNYSITEDELNILIESAVKDMNDAKEIVEKASK